MITNGSILMEKDALYPQCFELKDESSPSAWMSVTHKLTPQDFETELAATGWTFFYMANRITATAFGFNRAKTIQTALRRIIAAVRQQRCNCLEIDYVTSHSFLRIPYVSVSAHPRHIQRGMVFARWHHQ